MAQMPTIASTSNRRIMPSADLRVEGVSPAAFGAAVGAGLQQLGDAGADAGKAVQQFELVKQEEENRLAEFDRQTQFVAFGSDQATKLEEARRNLSGPAQDFTKTFMGGFDADATAFLEKVPERDRHAWQARMAQLRAGVAGDALRSEFGQRDAYYKTTIGSSLEKLQNGAMQRPDKLGDWLAQGEQIINTSGLSAQDKLEYVTRWKGAVAVAAAQGDVMRDPEGAIARLGGMTSEETAGVVSPTTADVASKIINVESGGRADARNKASSASGLGQFTDSTWLSLYKQKIGSGGLTDAQILAKKTDPELSRRMTNFLVDANKAVLGDKGLPATDANVYTLHFLGPEHGVDLIRAPADKPVESFLPKSFITANRSVLAGKTAGQVREWAARKMGGNAAPAKLGQSSASPNAPPTVDPRYADLPFEARQQLIGQAQREIDRKQAVAAQAEQEAHNAWLNQFMNDLNDGKAGAADIEAARKSGVLTDFDEINRAQNIVEQRNKGMADLATYNAMWAANQKFNPFDDATKRAVEAGFREAVKNGNAPLNAISAIWQRTGVLPESGAAMLRGGLVSTDANQVAMAASVASNMLQRNPNAFAGVQGGSDIEQAAALYSHYVNDLGLTAQDAAQRVAQRNAPEVKRRVDVNKPALDAFRTKLRKNDVGNMLSNAFGGWFTIDPEFTAPEQVNAAAQDYADFASEHYEQHGDESAAQAYAMQQMKKLYGAVNGRLMKFPPTRAYPAVQGRHDYIFEQAAGDIQRVTGRKIAPDKIYLMPIPSATAQAFRAGRPTPYSVHYIDTVGGQEVYRTLPGVAFTADVAAAQRAAAGEFDAARRDRQKKDESTRAILRSRNQFGTYN